MSEMTERGFLGQSCVITSTVIHNQREDRAETIVSLRYGDGEKHLTLVNPVNDATFAAALRHLADSIDPALELQPRTGFKPA